MSLTYSIREANKSYQPSVMTLSSSAAAECDGLQFNFLVEQIFFG